MFYYDLAISGLFLRPLSYHSEVELPLHAEVLVPLRQGRASTLKRAIVLAQVPRPPFPTSAVAELLPSQLMPTQWELARFIEGYYGGTLSHVLGSFPTASPYSTPPQSIQNTPQLSPAQAEALDFLRAHPAALLFADTGSGKSEIYISLIRDYLERGEQVALLMPEIALTPQMQRRLEGYFPGQFILWHSRLTQAKRRDNLAKFTSGGALLVAGARSALFLPFVKLGLIIIDEEHDNSYKNAKLPLFNAKHLASLLAQKMKIKLVLGSATPELTSLEKLPHFRLRGSFYPSQKTFIYDEDASEDLITPTLLANLTQSLEAKKQAIIFLPRRANFRQVLCRACGAAIKCPDCSVSMSLHKKRPGKKAQPGQGILRCHYCDLSSPLLASCPVCAALLLEAKKIGTAELITRLEPALPGARIARFDSDEITSVRRLEKILSDFNEGKIDILVGTSMLAKGHDYHEVDLAVILDLDEYLSRPNFRASEEVLALAMQVAGRAGRRGVGRVLLQTKSRGFFEKYIEDYEAFVRDERAIRAGLYPPFTRLARVLIEDASQARARALGEGLATQLRDIPGLEIVGQGACAIERLRGSFRHYLLLRSQSHRPLLAAQKRAVEFASQLRPGKLPGTLPGNLPGRGGAVIYTDMDPIDFS